MATRIQVAWEWRRPANRLPARIVRQLGFTLVELITVMVVVGILGAVAAPRFLTRSGFDARAYSDQVRSLLRFGQKIAIAQNRPVFVRLDGTSVALCYDSQCSIPNRITSVGGANSGTSATNSRCAGSSSWACEAPASGVSVGGATTFSFDAAGVPSYGAGQPAFTNLTVQVTGDATEVFNIIIAAETGYVR